MTLEVDPMDRVGTSPRSAARNIETGVDGLGFRCIIALLCCNFPSVIRKARGRCSLFFKNLQPIGVGAVVFGRLVIWG